MVKAPTRRSPTTFAPSQDRVSSGAYAARLAAECEVFRVAVDDLFTKSLMQMPRVEHDHAGQESKFKRTRLESTQRSAIDG